jgi:hypothetical protein
LPTLAGAGAASLPPEHFATGNAVITMSRQIGSVLGIALLIALLGEPAPAEVLAAYDRGFALMTGAAAATALVALGLGRVRVAGTERVPLAA